MIENEALIKLNKWNSEIPKFKSLHYDIGNMNYRKEVFNQSSPFGVVYCVFHHVDYLKFSFFSLLSQIVFTDIRKYNLYFIVDEKLYDLAVATIGEILPIENIIKTDIPQKYHMFYLDELKHLDKIIMADGDGFLVGTQPREIYKELFSKNQIILGKDTGDYKQILKERLMWGKPKIKEFFDEENYFNSFKNDYWGFNGFSLHLRKYINYKYLPSFLWELDFACDETVLTNNYIKQGIRYEHMNHYIKWVHYHNVKYFVENLNTDNFEIVSFVHPCEGPDQPIGSIHSLYKYITDKYEEYLKG